MNKDSLFILGAGGHAKVIIDLIKLVGYEINGLYDDNPNLVKMVDVWGVTFLGPIDPGIKGGAIIAIGNNQSRYKIYNINSNLIWKSFIHPNAILSKDVEIGEGSVVMAGAIIQSGAKIGKHCIINSGACVDHDCIIGDFVHIAPNCSLAGGVVIGEGTLIGIGSTVIQNIKIGQWSIIGAGSLVIHDQPDYCTSFGSPAKPIRCNNEK